MRGGGGSMLRLVFGSKTVVFLLTDAPGRRRAGEKNHECGTGRDELVECAKLGCLKHFYNIPHEECNFLARCGDVMIGSTCRPTTAFVVRH
jgi:hypothetical protein